MPGVHTQLVRQSNLAQGATAQSLPQVSQAEPSYYDLSFLKPPVWKWEIAGYFFFGGLSAGAYLIGRMAERFGGREHREIARLGSFVALGALLPCPPLLIADLGDRKRFHHMLRVWKPTTPMNLGSWTLTAYSGAAMLSAVRQMAHGDRWSHRPLLATLMRLVRRFDGPVQLVTDGAGVPLALLFSGYTGVLLSCTANPLWCKNPWLGPLFTASGMSAGASAISAAMILSGDDPESAAHRAIEKIDTVAAAGELICAAGFIRHAGENGRPLTRGKYRGHLVMGIGALVAAEAIKRLPVRGRAKSLTSLAAAGLTIASALSIKWAITYAGHDAANDPHLARQISRARTRAPESRIAGSPPQAPTISATVTVPPSRYSSTT